MELGELGRVGDGGECLAGQSRPPLGVATDEGLGESDKRCLLCARSSHRADQRRSPGLGHGLSSRCVARGLYDVVSGICP